MSRGAVMQFLTAGDEALWWGPNGDPVLPIRPQRMPHKVLSRGGSFGEPTDLPSARWAWLVRNLERLVYYGVLTGRVAVWSITGKGIRNGDAPSCHRDPKRGRT
jgi:hypothetical protein